MQKKNMMPSRRSRSIVLGKTISASKWIEFGDVRHFRRSPLPPGSCYPESKGKDDSIKNHRGQEEYDLEKGNE